MLRSVLIVLVSAGTTLAQEMPTDPVLVNSTSSAAAPRYSVQAAASSVVPGHVYVVYGRHGALSDSAVAFSTNSGDSFGTETPLSGTNCPGGTLARIAQPSVVASRTEARFWIQALAAASGSAAQWQSSLWRVHYTPNPTVGPNRMAYCDGGWSVLTFNPFGRPLSEARQVYVSALTGNDANPGTQASPKKSLAAGYAMLRDGKGDWLLLDRRSTWDRDIPEHAFWRVWDLSGRSELEPMVITMYDSDPGAPNPPARPTLLCRNGNGVLSASIHHVAIMDLNLIGPNQPDNGSRGLYLLGNSEDLLIEGCRAERFFDNYVVQQHESAPAANVRVRRNLSIRPHSTSTNNLTAQGAYFRGVNGLLIEDCVFDWQDSTLPNPTPATIFPHNVYIAADCTGVVSRGCISTRALDGFQQRPGGLHERCLHLDNSII